MLSGVGRLLIITKDLADNPLTGGNFMFPGQFSGFNYNIDTTEKTATKWSEGQKVTAASAIAETTYTLNIQFEFLNWDHLGFAMDEVPQSIPSVTIPRLKSGTVVSGEISDPDLGASTDVMAYISSAGSWGEAGPIPAADYSVSSGTLTLDAKYEGQVVEYSFDKEFTNIESIGHSDNPVKYGQLAFAGRGYGPEFPKGIEIFIPSITRKSSPSIQTDDVPVFEIEFSANVIPGSSVPHRFYNVNTAD